MTTSDTEARDPEWWQRMRRLQESARLWPAARVPRSTPREEAERLEETSLEVEYL